jgi:hypothetical protein
VTLGVCGWGMGAQRSVTPSFFCFFTQFLMLLEGILFDTKQDNASKDTFFNLCNISKQFRPKNQLSKFEKGHNKSDKKCHILFEWPLWRQQTAEKFKLIQTYKA